MASPTSAPDNANLLRLERPICTSHNGNAVPELWRRIMELHACWSQPRHARVKFHPQANLVGLRL